MNSGQVSPPLGVFVCLPVVNAKYSKNQAVKDTEDFCNHRTGFEIMFPFNSKAQPSNRLFL